MVPSAAEHCKQLDAIHGMSQDVIDSHIEFAKLHREAILETAAKINPDHCVDSGRHCRDDKQIRRIMESYPIELIK